MRRSSVLLSLTVAAASLCTAAPARAHPICQGVVTTGPDLPPVDVRHCVEYPLGVYCQFHHTWLDDQHAYVWFCLPA